MSHRATTSRPPDDVLTAPEAAARKGVHRNSVLKAIRAGQLEARKSGKSWLIDRQSVERWQPRGQRSPLQTGGESPRRTDTHGSSEEEAVRQARAQRLIRLLDEWMADESGHDEEVWPQLKEVLEQDRVSTRKLFVETTP
jgi:excisionase family DNA binding protein